MFETQENDVSFNKREIKDTRHQDTENGRATRDKIPNRVKDDTLPMPPMTNGVINVIKGGSKVSGVSYAASKKSNHRAVRVKSSQNRPP